MGPRKKQTQPDIIPWVFLFKSAEARRHLRVQTDLRTFWTLNRGRHGIDNGQQVRVQTLSPRYHGQVTGDPPTEESGHRLTRSRTDPCLPSCPPSQSGVLVKLFHVHVYFVCQNKHLLIEFRKAFDQAVHSHIQLFVYLIYLVGQFLVVLLTSKDQQFEFLLQIVIHYSEGLCAS